ncbi:hypothetical protein [Sphingobium baderi]|uniref:Uncharacterized protein n=1 Tax=Sphingobium baderi LL03 TaxID=1114964 RepID=T0HKC8_9SPHN|nr:hypothetical protein [Sphingobium baderi]EQA98048.1 hypothetical protein L485_20100 [Sphingobium baderi LL03]KMS63555.1 hypothetical protein V475_02025 [Sphingobium baderi LL03]
MVDDAAHGTGKSQLDKFKQAARELETDDDERHFKEKLAKVVKHKPVGKPSGS